MVEKAIFFERNPSTQIYTLRNLIAVWLFFRATIAPMVHNYSQNNSDKNQSNCYMVLTERWQEKVVQCFIIFALIIGCWPWNLTACNLTLIATQKKMTSR